MHKFRQVENRREAAVCRKFRDALFIVYEYRSWQDVYCADLGTCCFCKRAIEFTDTFHL